MSNANLSLHGVSHIPILPPRGYFKNHRVHTWLPTVTSGVICHPLFSYPRMTITSSEWRLGGSPLTKEELPTYMCLVSVGRGAPNEPGVRSALASGNSSERRWQSFYSREFLDDQGLVWARTVSVKHRSIVSQPDSECSFVILRTTTMVFRWVWPYASKSSEAICGYGSHVR